METVTVLLQPVVATFKLKALKSLRLSCNGILVVNMSSTESYIAKDGRAAGAVNHMKSLTLKVTYASGEDLLELSDALGTFMSSARELKYFTLQWQDHLNQDRFQGHYSEDPLHFLDSTAFPSLQHFRIMNTTIAAYRLWEFFEGHKKNLRNISLIDVYLRPSFGNWDSLLQHLPHVLSLETLHLQNLWESYMGTTRGILLDESDEIHKASIINFCLGKSTGL